MKLKEVCAALMTLGGVIGLAFVIDSRYFTAEAAKHQEQVLRDREDFAHIQLRETMELKDLRTQMRVNRVRLLYVLSKNKKTEDDMLEVESIREEMQIHASRISELQR